MPRNPNYTTCASCGRLLRMVDGPVCEECQAKLRNEAAARAAEARRIREREEPDRVKDTE